MDLHKQISIVRRHLNLLIAVAVSVFVLSVIVTLTLRPSYTGFVQIMLDPRAAKIVETQQVIGSLLQGGMADQSVVTSEVEVLKSRNVAESVVRQLKLDADPEFNPSLRPKTILSSLFPDAGSLDPAYEHIIVVNNVIKQTKVARNGLTNIITLTFNSKNSAKAAEIANGLVDAYLALQIENKSDAGQKATDFLSSRIEVLKAQVQSAETAVQQYKAQHGIVGLTESQGVTAQGAVFTGQTVNQQELANLDSQLAAAKAQEAEAVAKLQTARTQLARGSNGLDLGEALLSPVIGQLRTQRAELSGVIADLEGKYGPKHPDLLKARRQLGDLDHQIQSEIGRVTSNLEAQVQVAHQRTVSLNSSISASQGKLLSSNAATVQLNELERNAQAAKSLYQYYLDRYKQTTTQRGLEQADAAVVSRASEERNQTFPNIPLFIVGGMIMGLVCAGVSLGFIIALQRGVYTSDEIERDFNQVHSGSIPLVGSEPGGKRGQRNAEPATFLINAPLSGFAESFRQILSALAFSRLDRKVQIVAVTSALPGEGKTTAAICLGQASALSGTRTIVVDCDLRRRAINDLFDATPAVGLIDVLWDKVSLDQALVFDERSGVYFLPNGNSKFIHRDIFSNPNMEKLLAHLRTRFDLIVLDTAPILPVADTRMLVSRVDAVLMLVKWKKTPRNAISTALKIIHNVGGFVAGIALSQVDISEQVKAGYGDSLHYYPSYGSYYVESDQHKSTSAR